MPALVSRESVPIASVGTWQAATGEWVVTEADLADAVLAQHNPGFRAPILKIGHTDPRFTDGEMNGDGEPAVGRLANLRLSPDRQTLLADLVGVPQWLDEIMASAYPSRSVEAFEGVTAPDGSMYRLVITGLALLGVSPPAIQSLGDLADLYGTTNDLSAWVAARSVAASALREEPPMPLPLPRRLGSVVLASATIDDLVSAFEAWAKTQDDLDDSWVRDVNTDTIVCVVWDGDDTDLYSVPWSEKDGKFTFGAPVEVRVTYTPVPAETPVAAQGPITVPAVTSTNSHVRLPYGTFMAVRSARGREAKSVGASQETRVPIPAALAEALGVAADAPDDAILAAFEATKQPAPPAASTTPVEPDSGEGDKPADDDAKKTTDPDIKALVAASVKKALEPVLASLGEATKTVAEMRADKAQAAKDTLIGGAVTAGKITPADRKTWEARYDKAPDVTTDILGAMARGTAVPVAAAGHTSPLDANGEDADWDIAAAALGLKPVEG
jgi:hypothetical protein